MTKIAELKDRGSVVAWSPLSDYADVLALGTKVRLLIVLAFSFICQFLPCHLESFFFLSPLDIITSHGPSLPLLNFQTYPI
jgi:hypothetical protein